MRTVETLIIGGGVIGASIAYHLAERGCKNILVIERSGELGAGSTSRATGGFRCQFGTAANVRLSLLARAKLLRFKDELGVDSGYSPCGYLFLAHNERELEALRAAQRVQQAAGIREVEEVRSMEIQTINPALAMDSIIGGTFCSIDGFIRPMNILEGYARGAQERGVQFEFGVECQAFSLAKINEVTSKIERARTSLGEIALGRVINAAGAWAGRLAQQAGIEVPVFPLCRQVAVVREENLLPDEMPMTIFINDGFHFRVRDGRVLLLLPVDITPTHPFEIKVEDAWIEQVAARARRSVRPLAQITIDRKLSWAGLYEISPDKHALIGQAPGIENFYLANGSSGHGVMHAPAIRQLLAEIILDGAATMVDACAFRPSRFLEGRPNVSTEFL